MLQRCFRDASEMLRRCFRDASEMLQRCFRDAWTMSSEMTGCSCYISKNPKASPRILIKTRKTPKNRTLCNIQAGSMGRGSRSKRGGKDSWVDSSGDSLRRKEGGGERGHPPPPPVGREKDTSTELLVTFSCSCLLGAYRVIQSAFRFSPHHLIAPTFDWRRAGGVRQPERVNRGTSNPAVTSPNRATEPRHRPISIKEL